MTKRHLIAFIVGCAVAAAVKSAPIKDPLRLLPPPRLSFRSLSHSPSQVAVLMKGELPICTVAVEGDTLYTAGHCVEGLREGDKVEVMVQQAQGGEKPTPLQVYLRKVISDIAILSFSPTEPIKTPVGVKVEVGMKVVAVMGCLLSDDPDVYRTSLPHFEREGKVLAVFTAKEIGLTEVAPHIPPAAKFAIVDIGSFGGNSGSGVYLIGKDGKRHLIGVVSAGISDYTAVALF
jgi:hypothetical protein